MFAVGVCVSDASERQKMGFAIELLPGGMYRIEGQLKVASQDVGASHGDDAESD